jgi:hypothetical protein
MDWESKFDGMGIGAIIVVIILVLALIFGVLCFEGWLLMLLWNAVIPTIFIGAPTIKFWWAVGLILICNILFKSTHTSSNKKS